MYASYDPAMLVSGIGLTETNATSQLAPQHSKPCVQLKS